MSDTIPYVDFVISAGRSCRPAFHTKRLGLRQFSSPCDWMMNYSLSHFLDVLRTEGTQMFKKASLREDRHGVLDDVTGMVSLHDFKINVALESQLPAFYEKVTRRARNTVARIRQSHCVGILMNRLDSVETLIDFADQLSALFPETRFHIVNIREIPTAEKVSIDVTFKTNRYTLKEYQFNDVNPDGGDPKLNPLFWHGNVPVWTEILQTEFQVLTTFKKRQCDVLAREGNAYNFIPFVYIPKNGKTYVLQIEDIEMLAGTTFDFSVALYNYNTQTILARPSFNIASVKQQGRCRWEFTVPLEGEWKILLYAGVAGKTQGISLRYKNVKLMQCIK